MGAGNCSAGCRWGSHRRRSGDLVWWWITHFTCKNKRLQPLYYLVKTRIIQYQSELGMQVYWLTASVLTYNRKTCSFIFSFEFDCPNGANHHAGNSVWFSLSLGNLFFVNCSEYIMPQNHYQMLVQFHCWAFLYISGPLFIFPSTQVFSLHTHLQHILVTLSEVNAKA